MSSLRFLLVLQWFSLHSHVSRARVILVHTSKSIMSWTASKMDDGSWTTSKIKEKASHLLFLHVYQVKISSLWLNFHMTAVNVVGQFPLLPTNLCRESDMFISEIVKIDRGDLRR